jgi:hypothetical protein
VFLKTALCLLQLDQLQFAVGSPVSGTEEQQHQPIRPLKGIKILRLAELVRPFQLRDGIARS